MSSSVKSSSAVSSSFRGHYRNQGRRVLYIVRAGEGAGDLEARLWEIGARHGTVNVGLGGSEMNNAVNR